MPPSVLLKNRVIERSEELPVDRLGKSQFADTAVREAAGSRVCPVDKRNPLYLVAFRINCDAETGMERTVFVVIANSQCSYILRFIS